MQAMKAGCQKKDGTVDILPEGEEDAILVFVRLAEEENHPQEDCKSEISEEGEAPLLYDKGVRQGNSQAGA